MLLFVVVIIAVHPSPNRHSDVIWRQGYRSTLARVMTCCLTAPSHYLNQCWLMISEVLRPSPDSYFIEHTWDIYVEMSLKFTNLRLWSNFPGANESISKKVVQKTILLISVRSTKLIAMQSTWPKHNKPGGIRHLGTKKSGFHICTFGGTIWYMHSK